MKSSSLTVCGGGCMHVQARNMSSALSAASSACDHIREWVLGTPPDTWASMGVFSDGSYGAPKVGVVMCVCAHAGACSYAGLQQARSWARVFLVASVSAKFSSSAACMACFHQ